MCDNFYDNHDGNTAIVMILITMIKRVILINWQVTDKWSIFVFSGLSTILLSFYKYMLIQVIVLFHYRVIQNGDRSTSDCFCYLVRLKERDHWRKRRTWNQLAKFQCVIQIRHYKTAQHMAWPLCCALRCFGIIAPDVYVMSIIVRLASLPLFMSYV